MSTDRIHAGFKYLFLGTVNSDGFLIGQTTAGATAGAAAGEGMLRLVGAQTLPIEMAESEVVTALGDDEPLTQFDFEGADLPNGILELAVKNFDFEALVQGTLVETLGDVKVGNLGAASSSRPIIALLAWRRAKKWESGTKGVKAWVGEVAMRCTITPLGAAFQQRTVTPNRYKISTSKADRKLWGATLSEAINGTELSAIMELTADYPQLVHVFKGNGIQTAFTLPYTPPTTTTPKVFKDGLQMTVTTHYTINGATITFVSAPASNALVHVIYSVDEGDLN